MIAILIVLNVLGLSFKIASVYLQQIVLIINFGIHNLDHVKIVQLLVNFAEDHN